MAINVETCHKQRVLFLQALVIHTDGGKQSVTSRKTSLILLTVHNGGQSLHKYQHKKLLSFDTKCAFAP